MLDKVVLVGYGLFLLAGAYFGWKKGSNISLIAGLISGILVFIGVSISASNPKGAFILLTVISSSLTIIFLMRFLKTNAFMPSGMLLMVSLSVAVFCIARLIQKS